MLPGVVREMRGIQHGLTFNVWFVLNTLVSFPYLFCLSSGHACSSFGMG